MICFAFAGRLLRKLVCSANRLPVAKNNSSFIKARVSLEIRDSLAFVPKGYKDESSFKQWHPRPRELKQFKPPQKWNAKTIMYVRVSTKSYSSVQIAMARAILINMNLRTGISGVGRTRANIATKRAKSYGRFPKNKSIRRHQFDKTRQTESKKMMPPTTLSWFPVAR